MGEWIVAMRVDAELSEDQVGIEGARQVGDNGIEGLVPKFVVCVRSEGDVDAVSVAIASAGFVRVASSGKEPLPRFVDRDSHRSFSIVEPGLDAIAVVDIDVDVEDAEALVDEMFDGDHGVVEYAEAGRAVTHGMVVHTARGDEGVFGLAVEDAFSGEHDTSGRECSVSEHAWARRIITRAEAELMHRRDDGTGIDCFDDFDVVGVVEFGDLVVGCEAGRFGGDAFGVEESDATHEFVHVHQSYWTHRVRRTENVLRLLVRVDERCGRVRRRHHGLMLPRAGCIRF